MGTLNVSTLRGRVCEVVETLSRRKVDVCCIQKTRYRGGNCRTIKGKDTRYKLYWSGNDNSTAGVGVFVAEEWIEKVFEVQRVSGWIILVKLIVGQSVVTFLSVYAPQSSGESPTPSVALEWAATASSAMAASTGCTRNADPDYRCTRCQGTACPFDGRPQEVQVGPDKLEVVASFCYLGDMLSAAGGCELSTTTHVKTAWKKFKDLLPVFSSHHLSFKTRGRVYSSCVWSAILHASETWSQTSSVCSEMTGQWSDRSEMSGRKKLSPPDPLSYLCDLALRIWTAFWRKELRWYGHVERSSGAVKTAFDIQIDGKRGPGRPKMTWKQLTGRDCREWKLSAINPHDRRTWRSGVRSAMRAASQLSGRGPTDVDVAPAC